MGRGRNLEERRGRLGRAAAAGESVGPGLQRRGGGGGRRGRRAGRLDRGRGLDRDLNGGRRRRRHGRVDRRRRGVALPDEHAKADEVQVDGARGVRLRRLPRFSLEAFLRPWTGRRNQLLRHFQPMPVPCARPVAITGTA